MREYETSAERVAREALYVLKGEMLPVNLGHLELHLVFRRATAPGGRPSTYLTGMVRTSNVSPCSALPHRATPPKAPVMAAQTHFGWIVRVRTE